MQCIPITKDEFDHIHSSPTHWYCMLCMGNILPCNHFIDNDDFVSALYDIYADEPINIDMLKDLIFNPFVLNDDIQLPLFDVQSNTIQK